MHPKRSNRASKAVFGARNAAECTNNALIRQRFRSPQTVSAQNPRNPATNSTIMKVK
jgi:hypothetical protein